MWYLPAVAGDLGSIRRLEQRTLIWTVSDTMRHVLLGPGPLSCLRDHGLAYLYGVRQRQVCVVTASLLQGLHRHL
jgi:hypothetical protein